MKTEVELRQLALDKAGPMSLNGCPIFSSMQFLNEDETADLRRFFDELKEHDYTYITGGVK